MKKLSITFLFFSMFIVLSTIMLVSCGDDANSSGSSYTGDELKSKATGTWMCIQSTDKQQSNSYYGMMVGKEVSIFANGTYTSTGASFGYSGTYSVSGNKITAHSDNGGTFVITVSISGDRMEWNGTASNGVTFIYIFERESSSSTQMNITPDMIDEKYSFEVESFNISRGSDSDIQKGKIICFKNDGSCDGFHYMETAWRINNGRIETYYEKTNEPMYVYTLLSISDNKVTIKMNGTLDSNLEATIVFKIISSTASIISIVEESVFDKIENVKLLRNNCYAQLASFENRQITLENIRLNKNKVHTINANTNQVDNVWNSAWKTIVDANHIIEGITKTEALSTEDVSSIIAEIRAIRAFVYYNIAMLWGNVPLITTTIEPNAIPSQAKQEAVLQYAYSEISDVVNNLPVTAVEGNLAICRKAGYLLQAELAMTLGNKTAAQSILSNVNSTSSDETIIWGFKTESTTTTTTTPIYTNKHISLYKNECSGNTTNLTTEWANSSFTYGYWAALKRLGQAQSVTGCDDYELLMPIPQNQIYSSNNKIKQNPGY